MAKVESFRFWCQKVLPLVYDDSLSYYELLCKMVTYINNTINAVNENTDDVSSMRTELTDFEGSINNKVSQLETFMNEYFDNLDVQNEINEKLDAMAESGELSEIISPFIPNIVSAWLTEHITPTSPTIDNTLTISGAGADAKVVGDKFKQTLLNFTLPSDIHDANNVVTNSILFVSSIDGVMQLTNLPVARPGWLVTMLTDINTKFRLQLYFPFDRRGWYCRRLVINNWSEWDSYIDKEIQLLNNGFDESITNANDITTNSVYFVSSVSGEPSMSNIPLKDAGWIVTLIDGRNNKLAIQYFYPFNSSYYNTYYRIKKVTGWTEWITISTRNMLVNNGYDVNITDANTIFKNSIHFVSSEAGVTSMTNVPVKSAGWLFTYIIDDNSALSLQTYYPYNINEFVPYYRVKYINQNWSEWKLLGGQTMYHETVVEKQTVNNTYNINTTPTITSSTNGWLASVDTDTLDETNKTDMSGAIMSMLNDTGYCHLSEGIFYVSGNIDMPKGSTLEGCGNKTIIRLLNSSENGYICRLSEYSTIKNIRFSGSYNSIDVDDSNIGGRNGIIFIGNRDGNEPTITPSTTKNCMISNCWFENFDGSAIYGHNSGGGLQEGLTVSDCYITLCKVGINIDYWCEYGKFTDIVIFKCHYGCINNGGNNVFVGCTFHARVGFTIDNSNNKSPNSAHGSVVGCTFNHIDNWNHPDTLGSGVGVKILNVPHGFIFNSCQFFYGTIDVENSKGIQFSNCLLHGGQYSKIKVTGEYKIFLSNDVFLNAPLIEGSSVIADNCRDANTGNIITI